MYCPSSVCQSINKSDFDAIAKCYHFRVTSAPCKVNNKRADENVQQLLEERRTVNGSKRIWMLYVKGIRTAWRKADRRND